MALKIIAYEDRPGAGDSQPLADDLAVGIAFHHDRVNMAVYSKYGDRGGRSSIAGLCSSQEDLTGSQEIS